jgi:hypothetical protein
MAHPADNSQPHFAPGCRWGGTETERLVLSRRRAQGREHRPATEACDGERTFLEIVEALQANFTASDPAKIREDVGNFLESLQQKRIIDY